jgi:prolyl-tRNA synthetase
VKFANKEGELDYVWGTSWGVSTRLMGALIMTHSDDKGLVLPPRLAPIQVVIVPIYRGDDELEAIQTYVQEIIEKLKRVGIKVHFDARDTHRPGFKFAEWELKGVPVRLAIGKRDMENNQVEVARRDTGEKHTAPVDGLTEHILDLLDDVQQALFKRALAFREANTRKADSYEEFKEILEKHGGFILAHWDGTTETELRIKEETKATIRCIPLDAEEEEGKCIVTGKPSKRRVLFAKAY